MNPNMMSRFQQIGQLMKNIKNPQLAMIQMLSNNTNPMAQNILKMAQNGDIKGIEQFARNVAKEQGKDFDKEIQNLKNTLGL